MGSITTVEIVFSLYFDQNNEFQKNKKVFGSVFPSGSDEGQKVILGHFGNFWPFSYNRKSAHHRHRVSGYMLCMNSSINLENLARWKKVIQHFISTVVLLAITYSS